MEVLTDTISTTVNSFDLSFCICVNIITYIIIRVINDTIKPKEVGTWNKRLIMLLSTGGVAVVYYLIDVSTKLIVNSAILTPVFWSWIIKPICKYFKIDYKDYVKISD